MRIAKNADAENFEKITTSSTVRSCKLSPWGSLSLETLFVRTPAVVQNCVCQRQEFGQSPVDGGECLFARSCNRREKTQNRAGKGPADVFAQTALVATEVARVFQLSEFRELEGSRFSRLKTQTAENQSESGR